MLLAHPGGRTGRPGYCFSLKQSSEKYGCKCESLIISILRKADGGGGLKVVLAQGAFLDKCCFAVPHSSVCGSGLSACTKQAGSFLSRSGGISKKIRFTFGKEGLGLEHTGVH